MLDYELGVLNGMAVAAEIKKVNPRVPILMLADAVELPDGAYNTVDALLMPSDGPHLLWATVHYMLKSRPEAVQNCESSLAGKSGSSQQITVGRTVDRPPLLNWH